MPTNIFVIRINVLASTSHIEALREDIIDQIKSGVVILPAYMELVAVTGPCADVEVKMITREEKQGDGI